MHSTPIGYRHTCALDTIEDTAHIHVHSTPIGYRHTCALDTIEDTAHIHVHSTPIGYRHSSRRLNVQSVPLASAVTEIMVCCSAQLHRAGPAELDIWPKARSPGGSAATPFL